MSSGAEVERLKAAGNAAYASGDAPRAVSLYTTALELDGGLSAVSHVLLSNRAAALLARGGPGDALSAIADANAVLRLAPSFPKGYLRKAAALSAIGELEDAVSVLQAGVRTDPANAALLDALREATAAHASSRMRAAVKAAAAAPSGGSHGTAAPQAPSLDDALAQFEAELAGLSSKAAASAAAPATSSSLAAEISAYFDADAEDTWDAIETRAAAGAPEGESAAGVASGGESDDGTAGVAEAAAIKDPAAGLDEAARAAQSSALASEDLGGGAAQIERLTGRGHSWLNLNPYEVLRLPRTASEEDIRARFRRLSALVHPDKNAGDAVRAGDAFNMLRNAQEAALDPTKRTIACALMAASEKLVRKARRRRLRAGAPEASLPPLAEEISRETRKAFAEREMRRRNYEARIKAEAMREAAAEFESVEEAAAQQKAEAAWASGRDRRMEGWQSWQTVAAKKRKLGEGETAVPEALRFGSGTKAAAGEDGGPLTGAALLPDYKLRWKKK